MTGKRVEDMLFTWKQTFAIVVLLVIASGVFINTGFSSLNGRFDDVNARIDRLESRVDERFDGLEEKVGGLEAKVDANTEFTARLAGKRIVTFGTSPPS